MVEMTSSVPLLGYVVVALPLAIVALWLIRSVLISRAVEHDSDADEQ